MNTFKSYLAGGAAYLYPSAGDPRPPRGVEVLLLTAHGICAIGPWSDDGRFLGWLPLPKRDKLKEGRIAKTVSPAELLAPAQEPEV